MKHSIFGAPMKYVGVGAAKFSKNTHVRCGSVQSKKLLCAECAGVPKLAAHKYSGNYLFKKTLKVFLLHWIELFYYNTTILHQ